MDGPRDYHKCSETKTKYHMILLMWNLKYKMNLLQNKFTHVGSQNRITDVETKLTVTGGGGKNWDWHIYILYMK